MPITIPRLTKEQVQAIHEARRAKVRHARVELMKHLEVMITRDRPDKDYTPDEVSEIGLAEKIIAAYVDDASEGSSKELKGLLQKLAIDPRHVMTIAKRLLMEPKQ
jgi:hypothetical protein